MKAASPSQIAAWEALHASPAQADQRVPLVSYMAESLVWL